jgi:SAM-dependent methyltransferase
MFRLGQARNDFVATAIEATTSRRILDIGCGQGHLLAALPDRDRWGIDMDERAIRSATTMYPDVTFIHQSGAELPFPDASFDAAVLSEVIEHVGDENKQSVIDEAFRVLRPGGAFVFTAPYAGITAWTDPLDVKRRLPRIYGVYSRLLKRTPDTPGRIGHKHVTTQELTRLFAGRFEMVHVNYTGPLTFVLLWMQALMVAAHAPDALVQPFNRFRAQESGVPSPRALAFSVRIVARRIG